MKKFRIRDGMESTPPSFHQALEQTLKHLPERRTENIRFPIGRLVWVTALIIVLLGSAAIGARSFNVQWFLQNRRAEPTDVGSDKQWSVLSVSYSSLFLSAELNDAAWDKDTLTLALTFSTAGILDDVLAVYNMNVGMDGIRHDHIWTKDGILPVDEWAGGKPVYLYHEDVWRVQGYSLTGAADCVIDGKGETFLEEFDFSWVNPDRYAALLDEDGLMTLSTEMVVQDYATGETLEQFPLTIRISAPSLGEWRKAYDEYWM